MNTNHKSLIYGGLAVLSWSTVATAFKIAGEYMTPEVMVLVSTVTAFVISGFIVLIQKKSYILFELNAKQWLSLAVTGLLNPVAYYLVLFMAYSKLPAQVAQPINYTWPIILLIMLSVFNHQRIPVRKYIGMFISLLGVAFISFGGKSIEGGITVSGVCLGFMSAFLWAIYWLLNKKLFYNIDAIIAFFGTFMFGALYMVLFTVVTGLPSLSMPALLSGIYIGCFEMALPFLFFGIALRITSNPALINQMCYLSPFLSLFFIAKVLGEPIVLTTYVGLALIVGGIIFNELRS